MRNVIERRFLCVDCDDEFWSCAFFAERCPICRERYQREQEREQQKKLFSSPYHKRKRRYVKSVEEFMRDCEEYNRKHGTNLNYGTYDRLLRRQRGELAVEVKL